MSWFISLLLAGAVFTSGNNITSHEYQNTSTNDLNTSKNTVIDETERFEQTYPFNPQGKIEISNINGSIKIEAWDRPEIKLVATKIASTKERLADVDIKIDAGPDSFKAETDYKSWKNRTWSKNDKLSVDFELVVPRTAVLGEIESVNGSVTVSDMTNYTEISAVNGSVKATNLRGTAKLSTVNGTVFADFDNLSDDSTISLGTVNGTVKLSIPSSTHATVRANTVNGSISNEFGLPVKKGEWVGSDLYGRIGNGTVKIKLSSVNGGLSINNKDGGATNPVINLLPQKTSDEFDDSFEMNMDVDVDVDKVNADINKAIKESQKAVVVAQKEAEKRLNEMHKEKIAIDAEKLKEVLDSEKISSEIKEQMKRVEEDLARVSEAVYVGRRSPFVQEKTGSLDVEGTPSVTINARECDVMVRGWDKQVVKYVISRVTRTGVDNKNLLTKISNDKAKVEIAVTNNLPNLGNGENQVRVEVFVPKKSNLKIFTNRQIRLEGVSGELELTGDNEPINVRDSYGRLKVETNDGLIRIIGFDGVLETTSIDGDVYLEGNFKRIDSESNDGKVYLTLSEDSNALIKTDGLGLSESADADGKRFIIDGLEVFRINENTWRVGAGKSVYNFGFGEGKLYLRNRELLNVS
jgi:DUF4097 and DUF4098 domain-containing protein YvlB